jgi:hypothetical protein
MASLWNGTGAAKKQGNITKQVFSPNHQKRVNRIWLSCVLDLYLFVHFMYWLPILTGNALTGITKKFVDVVFYFLTIMNYG